MVQGPRCAEMPEVEEMCCLPASLAGSAQSWGSLGWEQTKEGLQAAWMAVAFLLVSVARVEIQGHLAAARSGRLVLA